MHSAISARTAIWSCSRATFDLYTDDAPRHETQEARLSLFDKGSYTTIKNTIVRALLNADITEDEVELLTTPFDLAGYKAAITEALYKGTKRNIESEDDPKNAEVG